MSSPKAAATAVSSSSPSSNPHKFIHHELPDFTLDSDPHAHHHYPTDGKHGYHKLSAALKHLVPSNPSGYYEPKPVIRPFVARHSNAFARHYPEFTKAGIEGARRESAASATSDGGETLVDRRRGSEVSASGKSDAGSGSESDSKRKQRKRSGSRSSQIMKDSMTILGSI